MAPAVIIDNEPDFDFPSAHPTKTAFVSATRTLLLAPASVAAHPESLARVAEAYDRNATDIQMLDRLAMGLVALPTATYDVVLLLTDVESSAPSSLSRAVMEILYQSMKIGGKLKPQSGRLTNADETEAILVGLVQGEDGMTKPNSATGQTVKLSFGKKKANAAAVPANGIEASNTAKRKSEDISTGSIVSGNGSGVVKAAPNGVGFVDSMDDMDEGFDDDDDDDMDMDIPSNEELERAGKIDPDTLLTEEDRQKPIVVRKWHTYIHHLHRWHTDTYPS